MLKQSSVLNTTLAAIAATGLICPVSASIAGGIDLLQQLRAAPPAAAPTPQARQGLPPLSNPKPFRARVLVDCETTNAGNFCAVPLYGTVPAGRVVQIDAFNCLGTTDLNSGDAFLNPDSNWQATPHYLLTHFIAYLPAYKGGALSATGPFYFLPGEAPTVVKGGSPPAKFSCVVSGTLWQAG